MKRREFIKFSLFLITNLAFGGEFKGENLQENEALLKLYKDFYKFKLNADIKGLDKILSDEFSLTHMTGFKQSKSVWLDEVKNGAMKYFAAKEDSVEITQNGDFAVITSKNRVKARIHGLSGEWNLKLVMNAQKIDEKWLIADAIASSY